MQIVDVVAVRDRHVSAVGTVFMVVATMFDAGPIGALVPVIVVLMMSMAVVDVVDMVAVRHRYMSAIGAVDVRMHLVAPIGG